MLSCEETQEWLDNFHNIANGILPELPVRRYLRDEVVIHNAHNDIWVIVNEKVLDLTPFFANVQGLVNAPLQELLAYAGKDLSHFFDIHGQPLTRISVAGNVLPCLVATLEPTKCTQQVCDLLHWWNEPHYVIGKITSQERRICIINTLTKNIISMTVCEEDTINDIKRKYSARFNSHCGSYTWRKKPRHGTQTGQLTMSKTLTENGVLKETIHNGLAPRLWLFYNDDFVIG